MHPALYHAHPEEAAFFTPEGWDQIFSSNFGYWSFYSTLRSKHDQTNRDEYSSIRSHTAYIVFRYHELFLESCLREDSTQAYSMHVFASKLTGLPHDKIIWTQDECYSVMGRTVSQHHGPLSRSSEEVFSVKAGLLPAETFPSIWSCRSLLPHTLNVTLQSILTIYVLQNSVQNWDLFISSPLTWVIIT